MEISPCHRLYRKRLYRNGRFAVTLATLVLFAHAWLAAQVIGPQYGHRQEPDKGPRALGLIQISAKGKARFTPIAIMMDGKFYDASAYRADPVPMALDFGIVYEGFRTGVSQGLFTITQPGQLNHSWIAEGKWLPAGAIDPDQRKKYAPPVIADDSSDDRPVLHRRVEKADSDGGASGKDKDSDNNKDKGKGGENDKSSGQQKPPASSPTAASPASPSTPPSTPDASKVSAPPERAKAPVAADENIDDPNRPRLRRGKPETTEPQEPFATFDALSNAASTATLTGGKAGVSSSTKDTAAPPQVTIIPAISDAGGPDPRPYSYDLKPAEEAIYRNKMLDLVTTQILAQARAAAKQAAPAHKKVALKTARPAKPLFDDVRLCIFDLSNSNEPVLVLSAKTHLPAGSSEEPKDITLIARTNLEGELRKLFFSETDARDLDVTPRMELIDAVDADGDGRGELLFRRTFDDGSAYAIYRVTADGLWPLFEGEP
jgi:hypothetical protein